MRLEFDKEFVEFPSLSLSCDTILSQLADALQARLGPGVYKFDTLEEIMFKIGIMHHDRPSVYVRAHYLDAPRDSIDQEGGYVLFAMSKNSFRKLLKRLQRQYGQKFSFETNSWYNVERYDAPRYVIRIR